MAKEVSGATINMSGRKGSRKRTQTKRFVQENELVSKSKSKTSTQPKLPSARGRGRPRQRARGATGGNLGISRFGVQWPPFSYYCCEHRKC